MVMIMTISTTVKAKDYDTALLAGGCFWCVESDFAKKDGVIDAISGYAGGDIPNPTYETYYKTNDTYTVPHLEVIKIIYDPRKTSFRDVVQYHFENIDPTDGGGQFADRGAHYRPAVFYKTAEEKQIIEEISKQTEEKIKKPVKVDILPDAYFYPAEDYHQDYYKNNPIRYNLYRKGSGRDNKIKDVWNGENLTGNE